MHTAKKTKYRVFYKKNKEFFITAYSDNKNFLISLDGTIYQNTSEDPDVQTWVKLADTIQDPPVLQEYTGFDDKYNQNIFDGDILSIKDGDQQKNMYVSYEDGFYICKWEGQVDQYLHDMDLSTVIVIGTINENPSVVH